MTHPTRVTHERLPADGRFIYWAECLECGAEDHFDTHREARLAAAEHTREANA